MLAFSFPLSNFDLLENWIRFVNGGNGWKPSKSSTISVKHFEEPPDEMEAFVSEDIIKTFSELA